jgi:hypothetical protein
MSRADDMSVPMIPLGGYFRPLTFTSPPFLGERVAKGWRGKAEPYPKLGEGVMEPVRAQP